jgi:cytochrome c biogenesis protein CcdA/thiol-disulfide isomerase/thioredoxin
MSDAMLLLMLFALIAGAGTAITPCVLPVLPALLSAGALGGRRRPLGIVLGLAITFTIAIVALAQLVKGVGLASGAARTIAIVVLIGFGALMLLPDVAARIQAPLSRLARFGPKTRGSGFWSGVGVGGALGFVCAPCAGPILAAVTSVSASTGPTARVVAVALAYAVGLSALLLLWSLGGRALADRIRRSVRGHIVERTLGAVLLLTGLAMAFNLDVRFEETLAKANLPAVLVDPTKALENSSAVQNRLASLRPISRFLRREKEASQAPVPVTAGVSIPGVQTPPLGDLGPAPEFTDTQRWFNTSGGQPVTLAGLRGHVVLVDFWTYTCINCIRTLPFLEGLYATYHPYGLEVVGVETPEFTFEQQASNVQQAILSDGIRYPVVQDNQYGTWNAYQNQYWPAEYLIDARGEVRHTQFGEGDYKQAEAAVRSLLHQAGVRALPPPMSAHAILPSAGVASTETYLDPMQYDQYGQTFAQPLQAGTHSYSATTKLMPNAWELHGVWRASSQSITPVGGDASITGGFQAAHIYLVMTSAGNVPRQVQVLLNGRPYRSLTVVGERLYTLVSLPSDQQGTVAVEMPQGVSAYDFTFG